MEGKAGETDIITCQLNMPRTLQRRSIPFLGVDPLCYLGEDIIRQILELGDLGSSLAPRGHSCRQNIMHVKTIHAADPINQS